MNIKKSFLIILVCCLITAFTSTTVFAGSTQKHRWEGVAIGIGAALLGSALIHQHKMRRPPEPVPNGPFISKRPPRRYEQHQGYWETREIWMPPTYKKVWNPGHYNRHGNWIEGHWIKIIDKEGHWIRERVWVTRR